MLLDTKHHTELSLEELGLETNLLMRIFTIPMVVYKLRKVSKKGASEILCDNTPRRDKNKDT